MIAEFLIALASLSVGIYIGRHTEVKVSRTPDTPKEKTPVEKPEEKPAPIKETEAELKEAFLKREAEELRQKALKKEQYRFVMAEVNETVKRLNESRREQATNVNARCPKCRNTEVANAVKFDANGKSYSVNKCKKCDNEWEKGGYDWKSTRDLLTDWVNAASYFMREYTSAQKCTFNPDDLKEIYDSLEDKKKACINKALTDHWAKKTLEIWGERKIAIESILAIAEAELWGSDVNRIKEDWNEEALRALGLHDLRWREQEKRDITGILDI